LHYRMPNRPKIRHSSSRPSMGSKARGLARSAGVLIPQDTATATAAGNTLTFPEAVSCTSEDGKPVARERPDF
jgi:hypothetical protein